MDLEERLRSLSDIDVVTVDHVEGIRGRAARRRRVRRIVAGGVACILTVGLGFATIGLLRTGSAERSPTNRTAGRVSTEQTSDLVTGVPLPDGLPPISRTNLVASERWVAMIGSSIRDDTATSNTLALYSRVTGTWELSDLPAPRVEAAAAFVGDQLLIWGGAANPDAGEASSDGQSLDLITGAWTDMPRGPLSARRSPVVGVSENRLLIWGGYSGVGDESRSLTDGAVYDTAASRWTSIPPLPIDNPSEVLWPGKAMWSGKTLVAAELEGVQADPALRLRGFALDGNTEFDAKQSFEVDDRSQILSLSFDVASTDEFILITNYVYEHTRPAGAPSAASPAFGYDIDVHDWITVPDLPIPSTTCASGTSGALLIVHCDGGTATRYDIRRGAWDQPAIPPGRLAGLAGPAAHAGEAFALFYRLPARVGDERDTGGSAGTVVEPGNNDLVAVRL